MDTSFNVNAYRASETIQAVLDSLNYSYTLTTNQATIDKILQELQKMEPVRLNHQENKVYVSL